MIELKVCCSCVMVSKYQDHSLQKWICHIKVAKGSFHKDDQKNSADDVSIRFFRSNRRISGMKIQSNITIQTPWQSRELDMVLYYFLYVPCFLVLGQVELIATKTWYFS
jgi:hypothetical protein